MTEILLPAILGLGSAAFAYLLKQIQNLEKKNGLLEEKILTLESANTNAHNERILIESTLSKIAYIIMKATDVPTQIKTEVQEQLNFLEVFRKK